MNLTRVTLPAEFPVSASDAAKHIVVDHSDDTILLEGFIAAATQRAEHLIGMSLVEQQWSETFHDFSCAKFALRNVTEIVSVEYYDDSGALVVVDPGVYRLVKTSKGYSIALNDGEAWQALVDRSDAVLITYKAGGKATDVPEDLKTAILLDTCFLYENRSSHVDNKRAPTGAYEALLFPYRTIYV